MNQSVINSQVVRVNAPAIGRVCDQEQKLYVLKEEFEDREPCAGVNFLFAKSEQNPEYTMQDGLILFQ